MARGRELQILLVFVVFIACLTAQAKAHAQAGTDTAKADALFVQGKQQLGTGNYAAACPMFAESFKLDAATGTLLALAICHERAGNLPDAVSEYKDVAKRSDAEQRVDRAKAARDKVAELEPKLPKPPTLAAAAPVPAVTAAPVVAIHHERAPKPVHRAARHDDPLFTTQEWFGLGTTTAGLVGMSIGTIFGLHAIDKNQRSMAGCNGDLCTVQGRQDRLNARRAGDVSTVSFLAGGALVITGVVLYFSGGEGHSDEHASRSVGATAWATPDSFGAGVHGAFE